ncbi:MAG TPA: DUF2301 domain-containing membrane protein [Nitrospirota bacterium]|nr:DUF2301 domain-containing membrane protein [Nitrospirota bacterium]
MGSTQVFQPLTQEDKVTVMLYRTGIVLSAMSMAVLAFLLKTAAAGSGADVKTAADVLVYGLYASVGMSVFSIHLYISKFKRFLKNQFFASIGGLIVLAALGKGSPVTVLTTMPYGWLLLLPLSGCLGFVTAKEAFCFKLFEGYLLAIAMPVYLVLIAGSMITPRGAAYGLILIAVMFVVFTLRKVFMPIANDIGDKTAYQ